ncbi:ribonuclease III [Campylobacter sp. MG1]|uniref:ribonuclease III n=1 Tax=Campylobacter sp. MG1 TaxID=2976332 RepID=UPI00226CCD1D|nr:ribonuclease III [Campylobacter sp. MG1]
MKKYLEIETRLGYTFKDENLLTQALTHKSYGKIHNERLEFLGDAVLDLVVANILYMDFGHFSEGDLSKLRAALVNEKSFAKIAKYLNIGQYLLLSNSEENNGGRQKPSLLSDAYEAIMGAIYLESGYEIACKVATNIINEVFPVIDIELIKDYKTKLQEKTQSIMAQTPEYKILNTSGPDHKKRFEIGLFLNNELYTKAFGNSKKEAEQLAAQLALERLEDE